MERIMLTVVSAMVSCVLHAGNNDTVPVNYIPKISGNIRVKYEYSTVDDAGRFAVNNARVKLDGKVMPWVGYRVQVDLCNNGKIRLMDAYVRLSPTDRLDIFVGQERVPFSVDASRDLHEYMFSDLSFGADYLGNLRSVGVKLGYLFLNNRIYAEAGMFNSGTTENQNVWRGDFTYGAKMNFKTDLGLSPQVCFMSRKPLDGIRHNMADFSLSWTCGRFFLEGEYLYCNYAGEAIPDAHAYNFMVDYRLDVNNGILSEVSFRGRFDGMTDISTGIPDADGQIRIDHPHRKRVTAGVKFTSVHNKANLSLHLNYQQYFYGNSYSISPGENNRLVAMFVLHF
ncbi:MAG: porin [Muribaculaceae bacterium]|nr:porin [Muribaculaceae bacterium]